MATNTIKSSFFVRKSNRLSGKKKPEAKAVENSKQLSQFDSVVEPLKKSTTVTSALKNVFHKKDRKREETPQGTDFGHMLQVKNADCSPVSPVSPRRTPTKMGSCCGVTASQESISLLPSKPDSRVPSGIVTPVTPQAALSAEDLTKACRRLLSPTKRKSDEENEFGCCSISPVKSPRSSADEVSPVKSLNRSRHGSSPSVKLAGQTTPKSCNRLNSSQGSRVSTSTPRRLFGSPAKKIAGSDEFTPKKLPSCGLLAPNNTPNSSSKQTASKLYQSAKRSLHTAKPDRLIGRDSEILQLEDFISERLGDLTSGSLYVSGPPGTGKTAVTRHVIENLKSKFCGLKCAFINCMTLKDSNSVFCHTYEQLKGSPVKGRDAMKAMERLVTTSKTSIVLILDEIDQLDSKHQDVLYRIFEWPALNNSKLVLVGIANALDLTDRVLPRLQASAHCRPALMNFAPYTSVQITDILKHRLERECVVEPSAINFCARKVSAVAGDMRKALDVCRRAVEIVEGDVKCHTVLRSQDCNSPTKQRPGDPLKKVTLAHISRVMNDVYGGNLTKSGSSNGVDSTVPLQQKLAVCSLLVLLRTGRLKEVLLGKLHEAYSRVCRKQQVAPVDQAEFLSMLNLLDSRGILALKKAKDTRSIKVSLKLDEQELETTLQDKLLLAAVLKDGIPK